MKNFFIFLVFLPIYSILYGQVQKSFIEEKVLNISSQQSVSFPRLCSQYHYQPYNRPRASNITMIEKDSLGRLWFTEKTNSAPGISIYDGNKWSYYDASNSPVKRSTYCLFTDSKGITWVGSHTGLSSLKNGSWTNYENMNDKNVYTIIEDKLKRIWCIGETTAYIYDGINWETLAVPGYNGGAWESTIDANKNIWFLTYGGIIKYDYKTFIKYTQADGLLDTYFFNLISIDNTIYALSNKGINKFDGETWGVMNSPSNFTGGNKILQDYDKKIWLLHSGYGTLFRLDDDTWTNVNLNIGSIRNMFFEKDGTKWFANDMKDIYRYKDQTITKVTDDSQNNISYSDVSNVYKDNQGSLWFSYMNFYSMGVGKFDGKNWTITKNLTGISGFCEDSKNNLYATGWSCIYKYTGTDWINVSNSWSQLYNKGYSYYDGLFIDSKDRMWFGNRVSIIVFDGNSFTEYNESDGIKALRVKKITQDKAGNIWVAYESSNSISKFNGSTWQTTTLLDKNGYSIMCNDIETDSLGNVWVGTINGLWKADDTGIKPVAISPLDFVVDMSVDRENNLWLCNEFYEKLYVYKNGEFRSYSLFNESKVFFPISIYADGDGNIFCGSKSFGAAKFNFGIKAPEIDISDVTCTGAANGSLTVITDSNSNYSYSINNGISYQNSPTFSNLSNGNYKILVKSDLGCISDTALVTLKQPSGSFDVVKTDISCFGKNDGSISVSTIGLDPVKFNWTNGETGKSISNLSKGIYKVSVDHSNNCQFERSFEIMEPEVISSKSIFSNVCGTLKGMIDVVVEGGTKPYTYSWSNGANTSKISDLVQGIYSVSVSDKNNCPVLNTSFDIKNITGNLIANPIEKYKDFLCSEELQISALNGYLFYQWKDKNSAIIGNTNTIKVNKDGVYRLTILDKNNCFYQDSISILKKSILEIPQICMITVDDATGKNKIVWNKINTDSAVNVLLFKESINQGVFSQIGSVPVFKGGVYIDENSDSRIKAEKYYISAQDQCSVQTGQSINHKTIHLSANRGTNGEVNLSWNNYEGLTYGTFNIYRSPSKSNMTFLSSIQSSLNSYTDLNPPSGGLYYQIEISLPYSCNPDAFKSTYSSIRSNIIDNGLTPVPILKDSEKLIVKPNPATEEVLVEFENDLEKICSVTLTTISGRVVFKKNTTGSSIKLNRGNIPSGVYILIVNSTELLKTKLVFQ